MYKHYNNQLSDSNATKKATQNICCASDKEYRAVIKM